MSIEEFSDLMHQTVLIESVTGMDAYGEPTYGSSVSYKARVVGKTKMIRDENGIEHVSTHTVYLLSADHIAPDARVTLPAGYVPQQPKIMSVGLYPDETELHHSVIYLE